jgi:hypothetical protein
VSTVKLHSEERLRTDVLPSFFPLFARDIQPSVWLLDTHDFLRIIDELEVGIVMTRAFASRPIFANFYFHTVKRAFSQFDSVHVSV